MKLIRTEILHNRQVATKFTHPRARFIKTQMIPNNLERNIQELKPEMLQLLQGLMQEAQPREVAEETSLRKRKKSQTISSTL